MLTWQCHIEMWPFTMSPKGIQGNFCGNISNSSAITQLQNTLDLKLKLKHTKYPLKKNFNRTKTKEFIKPVSSI